MCAHTLSLRSLQRKSIIFPTKGFVSKTAQNNLRAPLLLRPSICQHHTDKRDEYKAWGHDAYKSGRNVEQG